MDHSNSEIVDEGPSALEILLSNSAAAGVVESEGSFTIDFQAARSKLASFQLPDPSYYLLKLLQSAFWAQAGRVEIDLHRRTAEYRIHGWSPKVEDILKLLSRPELKDEGDPYQALAMGLQSLLAQGATVALQLPGRDQENLLVLSHDVEWRTSSAAWSVFALTIEWPKSATRTLAGDRQVLEERCFCYPLKLEINGEPWADQQPFWPFETELGHHLPGSLKLAEAELPDDSAAEHVCLRASLQQEARIALMRGGVVSDVVHKQLGLRGLDILLNGESLDTDLTGLQIRQDAKFEALLSSLHYNPKQLKNQAREAVGDLKVSSVPPRYGNMNSGLGCLAGIAMTYILIKVQLLVAVRYGDAASKVAMAALLFLFYQAFIKADRMGFRISHAPQGFEKHVIGVMLDKLK